MSVLYERLSSLCEEKGISGYRMAKDNQIAASLMTELKMGRKKGISAAVAAKLATYFGVSVDYLLGNDDQKEKAPAPITESERNIVKIAGRDGSFVERRLTDDQVEALRSIIDQFPEAGDDI